MSNLENLFLIYVAGSQHHPYLAAYRRILKSVRPQNVMHWGDIDVGGFRIAARLAGSAMALGHRLELWRMNPAESATTQTEKASENKIDQIKIICERYGWINELEGFKQHPVFQEQEFVNWEPPGSP